MRQPIRYGMAAILIVLAAGATTSSARADQWCGYASGDNPMIECGYTTIADCQTAVGKGGTCFVDPDTALNTKRMTPIHAMRIHAIKSLHGLRQETGQG